MRLKIVTDNAEEPEVDMRMDHFFAVMLDRDAYRIESAPIKLLPKNAFNCYFPIPFATFHEELPAEKLGSFPMADVSGRGFVAGMVKAVRHIDLSDAWFHTGGGFGRIRFVLTGKTKADSQSSS